MSAVTTCSPLSHVTGSQTGSQDGAYRPGQDRGQGQHDRCQGSQTSTTTHSNPGGAGLHPTNNTLASATTSAGGNLHTPTGTPSPVPSSASMPHVFHQTTGVGEAAAVVRGAAAGAVAGGARMEGVAREAFPVAGEGERTQALPPYVGGGIVDRVGVLVKRSVMRVPMNARLHCIDEVCGVKAK